MESNKQELIGRILGQKLQGATRTGRSSKGPGGLTTGTQTRGADCEVDCGSHPDSCWDCDWGCGDCITITSCGRGECESSCGSSPDC